MSFWKQLRVPLLILIFANVLFVFSKSVLDPTVGKRKITPFVFPATVPLPQWQFVASQPLPDLAVERAPYGQLVLPGRRYNYLKNGLALDIKMRYDLSSDGDVKRLIEQNTNIRLSPNASSLVEREHKQLGHYGLFSDRQQAYLGACINPSGGSTLTRAQFDYNRVRYDVNFQRLILWLFGQEGLRDNRCLWTHLSVPLNQSSPQSAYATLEQAWFSWYQWWRSRFPQL